MTIGENFVYELKKPFIFGNKGVDEEAINIHIECPCLNVDRQFTAIEKEVLDCFKKAQEASSDIDVDALRKELGENKEQVEMQGKDVAMAISAYGDTAKCYDNLKQIFAKTAFVNGSKQKITTPIWESMSMEDAKALLGEYVVNFIVGSLIQ